MTDFFQFREKLTGRKEEPPSAELTEARAKRAMSVSELTRQIDRALQDHLPSTLLVRGEMSNASFHGPSGHLYFTLKDEGACVDCVMWKSDAAKLKFKPDDGMDLLAVGHVQVYAQRGRYQLYVRSLSPLGQGALELAFQQMREKLAKAGLFASERKKPIPGYPRRIAIVTGAQTAALHDMLKVLRRFPWLRLMLFPVPVQGESAAPAIAAALRTLSQHHRKVGGIDVILLARGGGSLEDLWAFNEESVARAIAASSIPIVTGIGHEVDVSIADLVADHHSHTPTEAAQVVTSRWRLAADTIESSALRLRRSLKAAVAGAVERLKHVRRHSFFRRPMDRVNILRQLIDDRERALRHAAKSRLWHERSRLREMEQKLGEQSPAAAMRLLRERLKSLRARLVFAARSDGRRRLARLDSLDRELRALSPEAVLKRGYSLTTMKKGGAVVRSVAQVRAGDELVTRVADGAFESTADDPKQPKLF